MIKIAKFHYLMSSVIGAAATTLDGLDVSPENYNDAWEKLLKEYDDKRANPYIPSNDHQPSKRKSLQNCRRTEETEGHRARRALKRGEAGMPNQQLGPPRSTYYV